MRMSIESKHTPWVGAAVIAMSLVITSGIIFYEFVYFPELQAEKNRTPPQVKVFNVTAYQWSFSPSPIEVNRGDTVILRITATFEKDPTFKQHGFFLEVYQLQETLDQGKTVEVKFVAERSGTFNFFCTIFCGTGHSTMRGQLIVR